MFFFPLAAIGILQSEKQAEALLADYESSIKAQEDFLEHMRKTEEQYSDIIDVECREVEDVKQIK